MRRRPDGQVARLLFSGSAVGGSNLHSPSGLSSGGSGTGKWEKRQVPHCRGGAMNTGRGSGGSGRRPFTGYGLPRRLLVGGLKLPEGGFGLPVRDSLDLVLGVRLAMANTPPDLINQSG